MTNCFRRDGAKIAAFMTASFGWRRLPLFTPADKLGWTAIKMTITWKTPVPASRWRCLSIEPTYYSTAISGRRGSDFDATGIAWQYRFGGGL
jgi:hypothetical protein